MNDKDINNLKEMLVDFNEYSTDYTKTRCRELEETTKNTLKVIERLNKELQDTKEHLGEYLHEQEEENKLLSHRLEVANEYIESRKENMIPEHYDDLKYIINECDLDSTW